MKTNLYYLLLFLILLSLFSCKQHEKETENFVRIEVDLTDNSIYLSQLFHDIEPIIFETNDSSLIGEMPKIILVNSSIFMETENTIKIFDSRGNFLHYIDKRGNGMGEYLGISDFTIDEKNKTIEILDKRQKKILSYDFDGNYIKDFDLNLWAIRIFRDDENTLYVYCGNERYEGGNKYKFHVINDSKMSSFYEIDQNKSKFLHILTPVNLYRNKGYSLFFEAFNDTIYTLQKENIHPKYVISYKGKNVPESFYRNNNFSNVFEFFQEFNLHNYINSTYNIIENKNKLLFTCYEGSRKFFVLYDKQNNTACSYNKIIDDLFLKNIPLPFESEDFVFWADNERVLFLVPPSWFIENKEYIVSDKLKQIIDLIDEEDNPIGFMCTKIK